MNKCKTCQWFDPYANQERPGLVGRCCFNPPVIVSFFDASDQSDIDTFWPEVNSEKDGCGQWARREDLWRDSWPKVR